MQLLQARTEGVLQITPLERRALRLLAHGETSDGLAAGLGIGTLESEALLRQLFAAMGAGTAAEAVASAHRRGLLAAEAPAVRPALSYRSD